MVPGPMRRAQTALVIVAMFLVAGSLLPWNAPLRLGCGAGAIGIVLFLLAVRLRAHAGTARGSAGSATQARIDRIRADRDERMGRRR